MVYQRNSSNLDLDLFSEIFQLVEAQGFIPCMCPTSEYLNQFFLINSTKLSQIGWIDIFPTEEVYRALSEKSESSLHIKRLIGLSAPDNQRVGEWHAPCVLKPKINLHLGETLYPKLCRNERDLNVALSEIDSQHWFSQTWVEGQSFYLCAYLDRRGGWDSFWQENMLQQPGGKSIVLARACHNPGLEVDKLMRGLSDFGFHGPFMMELIVDHLEDLYFIEVNPRFWGPLNLAREVCPAMLHRFIADINDKTIFGNSEVQGRGRFYAWAYGAQISPLRVYPAAVSMEPSEIQSLLRIHDVYAYPDTEALSLGN